MATASDVNRRRGSKPDVVGLSIELVNRGELKILNVILLLSFYGAAVLSISLVLDSFFGLSTGLVSAYENLAIQELLSSVHSQASGSYTYVQAALFLGFIVTSVLSGISIGRKTKGVRSMMTHFGASYASTRNAVLLLLLLISFSSLALSYLISFVFSSVLLYEISLTLRVAFFLPVFNLNFIMYFIALTVTSFVSLVIGWSLTTGRPKRG